MDDIFFQIILCLAGVFLGLLGAIFRDRRLSVYTILIAVSIFAIGLVWGGVKYFDFGRLPNEFAEKDGIVWDATFYGNKEFTGPTTLETTIQGARNGLRIDWGVKAPKSKMPADYFAAVFRADPHFTGGLYCFCMEVDDGGILLIDGQEIRNADWGYTPFAVYKNKVTLAEGPHTIEFEYFENYEKASFHIYWYNEVVGQECVTVGHPGVP